MKSIFKLNTILLLMSLTSLSSCQTYSNDSLWNRVVDYFTSSSRTREEVLAKLSNEAIKSIIGSYPVPDTTGEIVDFFERHRGNHNYKVIRNSDTTYIEFNPDRKIASGPIINVVAQDTSWKVVEVIFGK